MNKKRKSNPHNRSRPRAFIPRNLLDAALDLDQIERLRCQGDDIAKDGLDFGQFVFVARDEVEGGGGHCGYGWDV